jgi:hypothetical protein
MFSESHDGAHRSAIQYFLVGPVITWNKSGNLDGRCPERNQQAPGSRNSGSFTPQLETAARSCTSAVVLAYICFDMNYLYFATKLTISTCNY